LVCAKPTAERARQTASSGRDRDRDRDGRDKDGRDKKDDKKEASLDKIPMVYS
jgi:hypothetical protein